MCGRYTLTSPGEVVAEVFELVDVPPVPPRYNLAPTQEAAVVRVVAPGAARALAMLRWGLIPAWAKDPAIGNRMINARAETAAEKPAFRDSFRRQRCLVAADGFYEWRKLDAKTKQPYLIRRQDRRPFAFAGLWAAWRGPAADRPVETFTILTTSPNELMRPLHDRMPVILDRRDFTAWLDPAARDAAALQALLAPAPAGGWEAVPVSRAVNNPVHDEPDCIEPLLAAV
ncbi:MAG TPA: SOS response-associated peptidase [Thermoanaerobaculia bacterium]|jgi:putative SOS response-associated peptidase YedK|nr:SOS response-associated peptidase [Thermoanaerobaculia bacterium]